VEPAGDGEDRGRHGVNLGRADEIQHLQRNALADRSLRGRQVPGDDPHRRPLGRPDSCAVLGANNVGSWASSTVGDGLGSVASATGGFVASPVRARSTRAAR
jgi:hypothetical protein